MTVITKNEYIGDGSNSIFNITFPYIEFEDVKVFVDSVLQTIEDDYTFATATAISFTTPPANGDAVLLERITSSDDLKFTFFPGSAIRARDLNDNFTQALYVIQESDIEADSATDAANEAIQAANEAKAEAEQATSTAEGAVSIAEGAVSTANSAVVSANQAIGIANTADAKADTAISTANDAATDAATALDAISRVVDYEVVADVAAIPGSPSDGDAVEVTDSTGIESFTPLANIPAGFVGSSALYVRLSYKDTDASWVWVTYGANDPESRYLSAEVNDTAAGEITFEGVTTHEAGVSVTGGDVLVNYGSDFTAVGPLAKFGSLEHYASFEVTNGSSVSRVLNIVRDGNGPVGMKALAVSNTEDGEVFSVDYSGLTTHAGGVSVTGGVVRKNLNDETIDEGQNWTAFVTQKSGTTTKTAGVIKGFAASNLTNGSEVYGFHSSILPGTGRYNFYAAADAPSYYKGGIILGDDPNSPGNLKTYETGTWTPGFRLTSDAGSFTYSLQSGSYTKVGRLVTCQGQITCTGKTGMTSATLRITGFPFPALNNAQRRDCGTVSIWQGFNDTRFPNAGIIMNNSVNEAELQCGTGGSTTANVRGQDLTNSTTRINFSITYTANS